jgi:hypothetical protein
MSGGGEHPLMPLSGQVPCPLGAVPGVMSSPRPQWTVTT